MRRIVALSLVILALLVACDSPLLPPLRPSVTTTPAIPPPRSNITRADYNAALAKWQQQGITDYEISVYQLSLGVNGVYQLRVQGDQVTVLSNTSPYPADSSARIYTVAGLFAEIEGYLTDVERGKVEGSQILPFVYWVTFDPVLGYPTSLSSGCEDPIYPGAYTCPSDTSVTRTVRDLTVLAPGTATPPVPPTAATTPTIPPPRSNITRADYNAALAKWQRQGISDYEISVYELSSNLTNGGVYRLRVQGDQVTWLSNPYLFRDKTAATPTPYPADSSAQFYTVAGLFAQIDKDLITVEQGKVAELGVVPYVYKILFDEAHGYPLTFEAKCDQPPPVCPSESVVTWSVPSLTVLAPTLTATPVTGP